MLIKRRGFGVSLTRALKPWQPIQAFLDALILWRIRPHLFSAVSFQLWTLRTNNTSILGDQQSALLSQWLSIIKTIKSTKDAGLERGLPSSGNFSPDSDLYPQNDNRPKIELLQAEVDENDQSFFRLLVNGLSIKYITVEPGI